jgi:hypothetical protein
VRALCAALAAAALLLPGPATAAGPPRLSDTPDGSIGIQLLEAPTAREADPRAHLYIIDYLAPGAVIHRRFEVTNTSRAAQHVDLYAAAASIAHDEFAVAADRTADELSGWIGLRPAAADLKPGGRAVVEASIAVPKDAVSGERYAVIWAQDAGSTAGTIHMVNRVGLRLYLDVGDGGEPRSDFAIEDMAGARTAAGVPEILAAVRNTGARALDMSGSASLVDGPGSLSAGPFPATLGMTLGVGGSGRVAVPLDSRLPDGPWTVRLTLASGLVQHTATAVLTFPRAPGTAAPVRPETDASHDFLVPLLASAVALLLFLLLSFWLIGARRRRRERDSAE